MYNLRLCIASVTVCHVMMGFHNVQEQCARTMCKENVQGQCAVCIVSTVHLHVMYITQCSICKKSVFESGMTTR